MTNDKKAVAIIKRIVELANRGYTISFSEDFGDFSLTVGMDGKDLNTHFHTYQGYRTYEEMIEQLYQNLKLPIDENR